MWNFDRQIRLAPGTRARSVVGQRDFESDGNADSLWLDSSGNMAMGFMERAQLTQSTGIGNVPAVWSIQRHAD